MNGIKIRNLRNTQRIREVIRRSLVIQLKELDERIANGKDELEEL